MERITMTVNKEYCVVILVYKELPIEKEQFAVKMYRKAWRRI